MKLNLEIFLLLLLSSSSSSVIKCERVENKCLKTPFGVLDSVINKILEASRPYLTDIFLKNESFHTGVQEFGNFKGNVKEVSVKGLEKFKVKILNTSFLDIRNLTIIVESFTAKGFYQLNGILAFPLGKTDIDVFGEGEFGATFNDFSISMKLLIRLENGKKKVKDFDVIIGLEKMKVFFGNIMGDEDLEKVFNKLANEVGLTIFNYYKEPIMDAVKPSIIEIINEMLNSGGEISTKWSSYNLTNLS